MKNRDKILFVATGMLLCLDTNAFATDSLPPVNNQINYEAQQDKRQVTGIVKDSNGDPIIGANVVEKNASGTNGTITDMEGRFSLNVSDDAVLTISYIGFQSQNVSVKGQSSLNILLKEDSEIIDDVVIIGYGSVKKSNLTTSVSKITNEALENRPLTTISEAFQGQLAGVQAQATNGGIPGEEMTIRIRGVNTVNGDSTPLYVIDGVPRDNMSGINPNDIATIQILKDASATSIYGSRGANGVVLIETKQGGGKPTVTFDAYYGLQTAEKTLDLMSGPEWVAYNSYYRTTNYMMYGGGSLSTPMADRPQDYRIPDWWYTTTDFTNWQDLVLRTAPIQSYNASASGQGELGSIYFSVGYQNQKGIVEYTDYNRYNVRLNTTLNLMKNVKVGANFSLSASEQEGAGVNLGDRQGKDSSFHHALMMSPLVPVGSCTWENGGLLSSYDYGAVWIDPITELASTVDDTNTTRIQTSLWGEWSILPGLTYKVQFSYNYEGEQYEYYQPANVTDGNITEGNSYSSHTTDWVIQNTLTYDKTFNDVHHLNILLGQSAEKQKYYYGYMKATGWPFENIPTLNVATTAQSATTEHTNYTNASFFGRINYDYKEKYLLSVSVRRDGSSRFGVNSKWGTFPSASIGWKINEENFLKDVDWITLLKFRVSFGTSGNDRIGDYQYLTLLANYNAAYGGSLQTGVAASNIANSDLQWEETKTYNFGIDFSAFRNRLQVNLDYYINRTSNLLFDVPIPYTTGFSSILTNIGEIENKGWEIDLTSHNIQGRNFQWTSNLNLSRNRNKVLDMGEITSLTSTQNDAMFITQVGGPVSQFYCLRTDGFLTADDFDEDGNALVPIADGQVEGNYKFVDQNGDGVIDDGDYVAYGNNLPDLTWGFTNRFSYKNFELSILLQGQFGGDVLYLGQRHNDSGMADRTLFSRWINCYKPESTLDYLPTDYIEKYGIDTSWDGKTPFPFGNNLNNADHRIYDATYVRIKNITLSYNFPTSLLSKMRISALKIYASIDNVYTFTDYPGYTPETSSYGNGTTQLGVDYSTYPLSRRYTLGLNLTF